jgi:hypothetical protein
VKTLSDHAIHGRGTAALPDNRYSALTRETVDDGWGHEEDAPSPPTTLIVDTAKSVITRNDSPDIPFSSSLNPYRGCEHGCIYCYARPSHAWLGLSPGLDFETRLAYKPDAAQRLRDELARPGYRCEPIALGMNTDAWQPVERKLGITRGLLEVLAETQHPVSMITKSALILRDLDLIAPMAKAGLAHVGVSITTLDKALARKIEHRIAIELGVRPSRSSPPSPCSTKAPPCPSSPATARKPGGLDDTQLRNLEERLTYLRELEDRRVAILASIEEQGKLTPELRAEIDGRNQAAPGGPLPALQAEAPHQGADRPRGRARTRWPTACWPTRC